MRTWERSRNGVSALKVKYLQPLAPLALFPGIVARDVYLAHCLCQKLSVQAFLSKPFDTAQSCTEKI